MKNIIKIFAISLTVGLVMGISTLGMSQPPNPPGSHGQSGNMPSGGGAAPVGSGLVILLTMAAAYGSKKVFKAINQQD